MIGLHRYYEGYTGSVGRQRLIAAWCVSLGRVTPAADPAGATHWQHLSSNVMPVADLGLYDTVEFGPFHVKLCSNVMPTADLGLYNAVRLWTISCEAVQQCHANLQSHCCPHARPTVRAGTNSA